MDVEKSVAVEASDLYSSRTNNNKGTGIHRVGETGVPMTPSSSIISRMMKVEMFRYASQLIKCKTYQPLLCTSYNLFEVMFMRNVIF